MKLAEKMLPMLSPLPSEGATISPPVGFRAVDGLQAAWRSEHAPFFAKSAEPDQTVAQLAGVRFEKKARGVFDALQLKGVRCNPWFTFRDKYGTRWCQPDIIFEYGRHINIVEVKHNHTTDAWFQLRQLYEPVVSKALDMPTYCLVLVEHFDPSVPWPEDFELLETSESRKAWFNKVGDKKMGIVICPR